MNLTENAQGANTIHHIIQQAVGHYALMFRNYSARETVASLVGMDYSTFCAVLNGERRCQADLFCNIVRVCVFPQAFDMLKELNFPDSVPQK